MRKVSRIAAAIGAIALISTGFTATAAHAAGGTHTVCASGCDFGTIQEAVDWAAAGDTIEVASGTYTESVTVDKSLTLNGAASGVSPNTSDPLTPANRGAETTITPPAGATNHGLILTANASAVTVSGFTFDLGGGAANQRFLNAAGSTGRTLTISNTVFTGATEASSGSLNITGESGNSTLEFSNNRITDSGASNGLMFRNQTGASSQLTITNNVWLDNRGLAMNVAGASPKYGTISDNWIGNSTPGQSGVDQFAKRQGGMVLAGTFDGLQITHNTLRHIEDAAFSLWTGMSGDLSITDNVIDGYSNMPGYAAVYVRPSNASEGTSDVSEVTFTRNSIVNPTEGSRAVLDQEGTGTLNAQLNWWGDANPDFASLVVGNVSTEPWYVDAELSKSSDYPDVPGGPEDLDELIEESGIDVAKATASFVPTNPGTDLSKLDPNERLRGELPWDNALDQFVDVYAYSTPVHLGTFEVVDGMVQLDADISGLPAGVHRLLFVGQTSGDVQVIEITVLSASDGSGDPTPPSRIETGVLS